MSKVQDRNLDVICITSHVKKHQFFLLVVGCFLLAVSLLLNNFFWEDYKFPLMIILFASLIVLLTAVMKLTEPLHSFELSRKTLLFRHRVGEWSFAWKDIVRFGEVKADVTLRHLSLPYIGIRMKDMSLLANNMSPRLANRLLHEQKELLVLAAKYQLIKLENGLISFDAYQLGDATYKGPIAAWLYRTEQLKQAYGYHLFIPESSFDRELGDFLVLLKQCHSHATTSDTQY